MARLRGLSPVAAGKPTCPQPGLCPVRGGVRKRPESRPRDPKPVDLARGRVKSLNRGMEAR
ncbi:60aa long hypothetical protein [Pyrococcus horikoshii OT3]|uniref:Uncharacterized protein n=1 Tax=Pyrococcus horikoshii (strain ATCC 700860 / DSM 12428 / JCM 9974 / NBRC 100139 / OT-3) TaxID=70601 RepID=O74085_PYRHO|nr:60aa long hypothetical protein [Pyrococcus horikoshii OT3]